MRRFYSHYTFIYPDIYLRNYVLEFDSQNRITSCFPFEKEIENTLFYSGLLVIFPINVNVDLNYIFQLSAQLSDNKFNPGKNEFKIPADTIYQIYDQEGMIVG